MFIRITEKIEASPEVVWNAISDIKTHVNWMAAASEIRITCVVNKESVETAINALHDAFKLDVE